jgi:copper chaperone NosL
MVVSETRTAAQLLAPGAEPLVFDDLGCLREYLTRATPPAGAAVFVADHRTREWVPAASAVFARVEGIATPMGSHVVAHRDRASRDAGGVPADVPSLDARQVFGHAALFAAGGGTR